MFTDNQYTSEYFKIIEMYKNNRPSGYIEKHHIIPKSLGGDNSNDNIVYLKPEDHFHCHKLLVEMTEGINHGKMWSALWRMMNKQSRNQQREYTFTSEEYSFVRSKHAENHSKRVIGKNNPFYGQKHSKLTTNKMSIAKKGKSYEEIFGIEKAKEMRLKRSSEQSGKLKGKQSISTCLHCGKSGGIGIMKRWHGNRCKNLTSYGDDVEIV
jgi:hypothetical protein